MRGGDGSIEGVKEERKFDEVKLKIDRDAEAGPLLPYPANNL